jgi:hypothetical protein
LNFSTLIVMFKPKSSDQAFPKNVISSILK